MKVLLNALKFYSHQVSSNMPWERYINDNSERNESGKKNNVICSGYIGRKTRRVYLHEG